jgi:pSer/pThr/pTyr-binding forkhead associated (FHA) protein
MECPSCWEDLSGFEYIYKFCPLCNARLPDTIIATAKNRQTIVKETGAGDLRGDAPDERNPEAEPDPPFQIYWKDELYRAGTGNTFEFVFEPSEELRNVAVRGELLSLGLTLDRQALPHVRKRTPLRLFFRPEIPGRHVARLHIVCHDSKDNPTVFETEDFVFVVEKEKEPETHTTFNIGDIISVGEVTLGTGKPKQPSASEGYRMAGLDILYNDMETRRLRTGFLISQIMTEARKLYEEGALLLEASGRSSCRRSGGTDGARDLLNRAKQCFVRIRQKDPDHEESLRFIGKINDLIPPRPEGGQREDSPERMFDSCLLHLDDHGSRRKVFLFSKETIGIGKDGANDIVIPHIDYISQTHARIRVNKLGEFFIRDTGTDGKGSRNGTFLNGSKDRLAPQKDCPLRDGTIINLGQSLGLFCQFLWGTGKGGTDHHGRGQCITVTGEPSDTCFGIDKWGIVNGVKLKMGNIALKDEYVILLREITLGSRNTNGIVVRGDRVSDIHARIFYRAGQYLIEDLNSLNGTFLNGDRLDPGFEYPLTELSDIIVGDTKIRGELRG